MAVHFEMWKYKATWQAGKRVRTFLPGWLRNKCPEIKKGLF